MNILIAMNDAFVRYYEVTLKSLCVNNTTEQIHIYLPYTSSLGESGMAVLRRAASENGAVLHEIPVASECFPGLHKLPLGMWSIEMFYRLFAMELIPDTQERVLWLDGDVIVNGDITEFYHTDFEGNYFAACEDLAVTRGKDPVVYAKLGLAYEEPYYNSGVLLINLKDLRNAYSSDIIIQYALEHMEQLLYPDQDITNLLFHGRIKRMDGMQYNCQMTAYSYKQGKELLQKARIIHFAACRPWKTDYQKHFSSAISGDIWWKYARMCGYTADYIKWKIINTIRVKPWQIVYRILKG